MATPAHKIDIAWERRPAGVVAHVTYDHARRLNVLNPPALLDLTEAFQSLSREADLRVVVFAGAGGRAFIGGADINHMAAMRSSEDGRARRRESSPTRRTSSACVARPTSSCL